MSPGGFTHAKYVYCNLGDLAKHGEFSKPCFSTHDSARNQVSALPTTFKTQGGFCQLRRFGRRPVTDLWRLSVSFLVMLQSFFKCDREQPKLTPPLRETAVSNYCVGVFWFAVGFFRELWLYIHCMQMWTKSIHPVTLGHNISIIHTHHPTPHHSSLRISNRQSEIRWLHNLTLSFALLSASFTFPRCSCRKMWTSVNPFTPAVTTIYSHKPLENGYQRQTVVRSLSKLQRIKHQINMLQLQRSTN